MLGKLLIAAGMLATISLAATTLGKRRWEAGTKALRERIEAARLPVMPRTVDLDALDGLPAPVQRYFRTVLRQGMPMLASARMQHRGMFNMGSQEASWKPFESDQLVVTRRPGFDWDARIAMMPGLPVHVHDAYAAGEGVLHAALLGLVPLADMHGGAGIAQGELMRFLAEAAWYPTALLPGQGVRWEAVDAYQARATLADGPVSVTLQFRFNADGLIDTVQAEVRGRTVGKRIVPTPWQGRFWNYQTRSGMLVPLEGEVSWLTAEGALPYWRGTITAIEYQAAK
ncbi:hypothetical protein KTQ42_22310 [Noviherbaspirillum sp. L7-7A]|uniref:DUF6920 family protein n=1 Tax=Noviherbaspirillum sp. L7-7A TaxID=2850560 RepID=UPI001C2CB73F|nr:DUF6544 family protein [Noviherbaspirillum sp. L7-7A]MBV0882016.1 hypothetical protein [Noviherbaspirillum sp. L7-7A]